MSRLNSEALRRRWQNAAYREKQTEANRVASRLAIGVPRVKRTKGIRMSEEIAQAAGDIAYWQRCAERAETTAAVALSDLAAAIRSRDQALRSARAEMAARVALESQLGQAYAEIARLEAVLRQARGRMSIRSARKVIDQAIGKENGK